MFTQQRRRATSTRQALFTRRRRPKSTTVLPDHATDDDGREKMTRLASSRPHLEHRSSSSEPRRRVVARCALSACVGHLSSRLQVDKSGATSRARFASRVTRTLTHRDARRLHAPKARHRSIPVDGRDFRAHAHRYTSKGYIKHGGPLRGGRRASRTTHHASASARAAEAEKRQRCCAAFFRAGQ